MNFETNPGPESKRCQEFSVCHWNLNSIATHSFIKISFIKRILLFIITMSFVCQKYFLIQVYQLMLKTWRYQAMT